MSKKKEALSFANRIVLITAAMVDVGLLMLLPVNGLILLIVAMGGGLIVVNILNYYATQAICKRTQLNALILALFLLIFQIVGISIGILIIMLAHNGEIVTCFNTCSHEEYFDLLGYSLLFAQVAFLGSYLALIVDLISDIVDAIGRKKHKRKKKK